MNGATVLVSCARKLDDVERAVEDLQYAQNLQGEALHNKISKLQVNTSKALAELACSSDIRATLTPTMDQDDAASLLRKMGDRLQTCEKVQEQLVTSVTEALARNEFIAVSALKAIEERLEKLEEFGYHMSREAETTAQVLSQSHLLFEERLVKLEEFRDHVAREAGTTAQIQEQNNVLVGDEALHEACDERVTPSHGEPINMIGARSAEQSSVGLHVDNRKNETEEGTSSIREPYEFSQNLDHTLFDSRSYTFQESVYDAGFFVGSVCVSNIASLMITVAFGLNMVMQLGVVSILGSDHFTKRPFSDGGMHRYEKWRYAESHSFYNVDETTGTSLAARVCYNDEALGVASSQMQILEQASNYLHGGKGQFLRSIAIILWFFCCALELRRTLSFVMAIFYLPTSVPLSHTLSEGWVDFWNKSRSDIRTDEDGVRVISLSIPRVVMGLGLAACRILVAALLLYYGCQWLTFTTSLLDLLLNASALSFVLDIDETIYGVMAPLRVQGLIISMNPLRLPNSRLTIAIPLIIMVSAVAFTTANHVIEGEALTKDMEYVKGILCSNLEKLDFVLGTNALGWTTFAKSVPYSSSFHATQPLLEVREHVAQFIIDGDPTADRYFLNLSTEQTSRNIAAIKDMALMTLEDLTKLNPCVDLPWNPGFESDAKLGGLLWSALAWEELRGVTMCSEVEHLCHEKNTSQAGRNVRFMCPITCGCANPKSGLWDLFRAEAGCPETNCVHAFTENRMNTHYHCEDINLADLKAMKKWDFMLHRMYESDAINSSVLQNLTTMGCKALEFLSASQREELCQSQGSYAFHGAGFMCPISCGCLPDPDDADSSSFDGRGLCPNTQCKSKYFQAVPNLNESVETTKKRAP